jgi:hypothetical protein
VAYTDAFLAVSTGLGPRGRQVSEVECACARAGDEPHVGLSTKRLAHRLGNTGLRRMRPRSRVGRVGSGREQVLLWSQALQKLVKLG